LFESGGRTKDLTMAQLDRIARERLGHPLGLAEASLHRALSPLENVAVRRVTGGPAPNEAGRSIKASRTRFAEYESWWRKQREQLEQARLRLDTAASELAGSDPHTSSVHPLSV
jgi:argininosuccinate lyase